MAADAGAVPFYTVPDGDVAVIRCVTAISSSSTHSGVLYAASGVWYLNPHSTAGPAEYLWSMRIVIPGGTTFGWYVSTGAWQVSISGYLLHGG